MLRDLQNIVIDYCKPHPCSEQILSRKINITDYFVGKDILFHYGSMSKIEYLYINGVSYAYCIMIKCENILSLSEFPCIWKCGISQWEYHKKLNYRKKCLS
jgi:hypothetical protein